MRVSKAAPVTKNVERLRQIRTEESTAARRITNTKKDSGVYSELVNWKWDPSKSRTGGEQWAKIPRSIKHEKYLEVIRKIRSAAKTGNIAAQQFMEAWYQGRVELHLRPDSNPGNLGFRKRIGGADKDPRIFVNPFLNDRLRTVESMAATGIHEFAHMMGKGELMAHFYELGFILHLNIQTHPHYKLAQEFLNTMTRRDLTAPDAFGEAMLDLHEYVLRVYEKRKGYEKALELATY
jgi:hypothetical protein